jgi:GTP-binding protein HflX
LVTEKTKEYYTLDEWRNTWMNELNEKCLFISAIEKDNMDQFKEKVFEEVKKIHMERFPYNDYLYYEYDKDGNEL